MHLTRTPYASNQVSGLMQLLGLVCLIGRRILHGSSVSCREVQFLATPGSSRSLWGCLLVFIPNHRVS